MKARGGSPAPRRANEAEAGEPLGAQALRDLGLGRSDCLSYRVDPDSRRVVATRRCLFDDLPSVAAASDPRAAR